MQLVAGIETSQWDCLCWVWLWLW